MTYAHYVLAAEWIIRIVMAVIIIPRRRPPAATLAWLVVVGFLPLPGAVLYFMIGENRLGWRRSRIHAEASARIRLSEEMRPRYQEIMPPVLADKYQPIADLADSLGADRVLGGNSLTLLSETEQMIGQLASDVEAAREHCHLLYYIFSQDGCGRAVADALVRASRRGVNCRLLVDAVGSKDFLRSRLRHDLQSGGIHVAAALPVTPIRAAVARLDLRNHRKLAVIDGRVAYTGSHNLSGPIYPRKARYGAWADATVRLTGPAVCLLQKVFLEDWYFTTGDLPSEQNILLAEQDASGANVPVQVLPCGPQSMGAPLEDVMLQAIRMSRKRAVITTPYFVPDEAILAAMCSAAVRGVEVLLIVPKHSDHFIAQAAGRSHYGHLLEVGIQIHEFTAGLLHAKTLTVDHEFALIGSANLDVRSFMLNFELAVLVYDEDFASQLHFLQTAYLERSERLTIDSWKSRGAMRRFGDNIAKLMTPLL